jgi:endonuclease/exonuclease/phosphatase family metal-dependent hydrolase
LTLLCGDFNALPAATACRLLRARLDDAQLRITPHRPKGTFSGRLPAARIDHVFIDPRFDVITVQVPRTELTRVASDHLPLILDLRMKRAEPARPHDTDTTPSALRL